MRRTSGQAELKVLHAAKFYPPVVGGMESLVGALCDGTASAWDVRVVAAHELRQTVEESCRSVRVERVGSMGLAASVPLCPSLPLHLWRESADCVVLHEPNPVAGSALFLRMPASRLIVWHHSDLVRPCWAPHTYGRIQRALYRRADCVVVTSPVVEAQSSLVRHARRVAVIPIGIELERFSSPEPAGLSRDEDVRARWGPGRALRILFVGRLVYYKGISVLIEAMTRCPGTLVIVGDGSLEGDLRQQIAAFGLQSRVNFVGRVSEQELPAYYRSSDVLVLPSVAKTEAYGLVQIEAMAASVPVVSTNLPTGVPWVNQHGVTGLIVPPGDATELAAALTRLSEDPALRRTLGENGRRRAVALFSRERMVGAFKDLVETTIRAPELLDTWLPYAEPT